LYTLYGLTKGVAGDGAARSAAEGGEGGAGRGALAVAEDAALRVAGAQEAIQRDTFHLLSSGLVFLSFLCLHPIMALSRYIFAAVLALLPFRAGA